MDPSISEWPRVATVATYNCAYPYAFRFHVIAYLSSWVVGVHNHSIDTGGYLTASDASLEEKPMYRNIIIPLQAFEIHRGGGCSAHADLTVANVAEVQELIQSERCHKVRISHSHLAVSMRPINISICRRNLADGG